MQTNQATNKTPVLFGREHISTICFIKIFNIHSFESGFLTSLTCVLHLCKLTLDPLLVLYHLNNKEPTKRRAATGDDYNAP